MRIRFVGGPWDRLVQDFGPCQKVTLRDGVYLVRHPVGEPTMVGEWEETS